jgi:hypothetical protein
MFGMLDCTSVLGYDIECVSYYRMCSQVMFGMLDCMDILGYDNPWLVNDLRMQVPKPSA